MKKLIYCVIDDFKNEMGHPRVYMAISQSRMKENVPNSLYVLNYTNYYSMTLHHLPSLNKSINTNEKI